MHFIGKFGSKDANRVSFSDFEVRAFAANNAEILFESDAIYIDGHGLIEAPTECRVAGRVTLREYDHERSRWTGLDINSPYHLKDICEWVVEGDTLFIRGFQIESGRWNEYRICDFELWVQRANQGVDAEQT